MKKILLASGDSYTDPNFISDFHPDLDTSWPMWPELLADKLDMQCVNLGKSGAGNEYIYSSLLDYITDPNLKKEDIGLVVAGWSQIQRKDYQTGQSGRWTNMRIDPHGDAFSLASKSLRYYLSFQIMCERYKLNYLQVQMINFHSDFLGGLRYGANQFNIEKEKIIKYPYDKEKDKLRVYNSILNNDYRINHKKFIGWPIAKELGGFTLGAKNSPIFPNGDLSFKISELDEHPNALGQRMIAEYIHDRLG